MAWLVKALFQGAGPSLRLQWRLPATPKAICSTKDSRVAGDCIQGGHFNWCPPPGSPRIVVDGGAWRMIGNDFLLGENSVNLLRPKDAVAWIYTDSGRTVWLCISAYMGSSDVRKPCLVWAQKHLHFIYLADPFIQSEVHFYKKAGSDSPWSSHGPCPGQTVASVCHV